MIPYLFFEIIFCVEFAQAYYDNTKPIVMMEEYKLQWRTLDCWECFGAQGKMCSFKDNTSMI